MLRMTSRTIIDQYLEPVFPRKTRIFGGPPVGYDADPDYDYDYDYEHDPEHETRRNGGA